jgi:hypothetical protein
MLRDSTKDAGYFVWSISNVFAIRDGSAAAAARGLLWPAQAPTCQVGGPPPGGGMYKWTTKRHAEGRPPTWSKGAGEAVQIILRTLLSSYVKAIKRKLSRFLLNADPL